jgi:hypothetical protein
MLRVRYSFLDFWFNYTGLLIASKYRKKAEKVITITPVRDILSPIIYQLNLSIRI